MVSKLGESIDEKRHAVRTMNANTDYSTGMPKDAVVHATMLEWHSAAATGARIEARKLEQVS